MAKLTKRTVDVAVAGERDRFVWDDELPGFGLKVTPASRKTFIFQYRLGGRAGATKRMTLGPLGALTPEEARREATRLRGSVAQGQSPTAERAARKHAVRAERAAPTVTDLARDFLEDRRAKKKATMVAEYDRFLTRDVLPVLGKAKVAEVTRAQVARLHLALSDRPYPANRALAVLGAMFRFAELHGHRAAGTNPCGGVDPYPERARERFLSGAEFAALGAALARAEREGLPVPAKLRRTPKRAETAKHRRKAGYAPQPANPFAVAALRFLLLTGWRESEALTLEWAAVDVERGIATLADTKTGRSARHLGAPALALLAGVPRVGDSPYVFPGAKPGAHLADLTRVWEAVRHATGLANVRLHDLRHSFASTAVSGGLSLPVLAALLGHREVATTQRYAHLGDDPRRRAADRVSGDVAAALSGDGSNGVGRMLRARN
jgi:integrase